MVELLVVLLLIALASGLVGLSLRDGGEAKLEREASRLSAMLEAGRAASRTSGVAVRFVLVDPADNKDAGAEAFRFVGLPDALLPQGLKFEGSRAHGRWLDADTQASIVGASALLLGPEPLIGAQRILLRLGDKQKLLSTDGLAPFGVQEPAP